MTRKKKRRDPPPPKQPRLCVGCIWGKWEGAKQFCSRMQCVKEGR